MTTNCGLPMTTNCGLPIATNCGLPMTNKFNVCVTASHDQPACSSSAPAACGVSMATGCNVAVANCGKSANSASSASCHQRHSKVFVSNGGVPYSAANGNKPNGCNERPNTGNNATGCKRLLTGATVAKACNSRLSSPPDCNQTVSKPASTVVTIATIVTEPTVTSKRESCASTATAASHNPTSGNISPMIDCTRESSNVSSAVGCSVAPCSDGRVATGCKSTENGVRQSQAPKRHSGNCSKRSSAVECEAAPPSISQLPKTEDFGEKHLPIVSQGVLELLH